MLDHSVETTLCIAVAKVSGLLRTCRMGVLLLNTAPKLVVNPFLLLAGDSGTRVEEFCRELLSRAFRGLYPIETGHLGMLVREGLPSTYPDTGAVEDVVESLTVELESKLDAVYAGRVSKP